MYNEDVYPEFEDEIPPLYLIDIPEEELNRIYEELFAEQEQEKKGNQ